MDDKALAYFSSINPLARKIIKDEGVLKNAIGDRWGDLSWQEQEALIDDYMVDNSVREKYAQVDKTHSYPKSFPKLKVETGEKIVVDFENDCWTWQDEHSAPFNWRTKSQQDLTLDELEPDVLCSKPANKPKKPDPSNNPVGEQVEETKEGREFSLNMGTSIWESPFLQGMKKPEYLNKSRSTSPTKSAASHESLITNRSKTPEEVNYAFTGSVDDLSSSISIPDGERCSSASSGEVRASSPAQGSLPSKSSRGNRSVSRSPVKSLLSVSKKSDSGSQSLVLPNDEDQHAFDNPVLRSEWSAFVNKQEEDEVSSSTPSPYRSLLNEPEPVNMQRGESDYQSNLLTGSQDNFQDEILYVEQPVDSLEPGNTDIQSTSVISKTGFDFLDNW